MSRDTIRSGGGELAAGRVSASERGNGGGDGMADVVLCIGRCFEVAAPEEPRFDKEFAGLTGLCRDL